MANSRRIKVTGVRREEIDTEQLALVYWLQAKRILKQRRVDELAAKVKRKKIEGSRER